MRKPELARTAIIAVFLTSIVVYGVALRLQDPLATQALGAEDPYTHVVLIREYSEAGAFGESFHLGIDLYPPGMHAFVGAFASLAGIDVYDFARLGPPFLAALGILGMFALGSRLAGPAGGLGAAFLVAVMPEHIFRSELFFPTAFDLALLPLWLLAFHLALTERSIGASVLFVAAGISIVIMHPWVVPLFAAPLAFYAMAHGLRTRLAVTEVARVWALLVLPIAFAMAFRWHESDTGFADFLSHVPGLAGLGDTSPPVLLIFTVATLALMALVSLGAGVYALLARIRLPAVARWGGAALLAACLFAAIPLLAGDLPPNVSYEAMLGWVALPAALVGLALVFVRPTAAGEMGLAIALMFYPLTAVNVFESEFWPQRTVAFLTLGVALLGGHALQVAYEFGSRLTNWRSPRASAGTAALVAACLLMAGAAVAVPADTYQWYRLYNEDDFAAFQEVVEVIERDPDAKVFVHGWQPALMVKALADPNHVWYSPNFFVDAAKRDQQLGKVEGPAYVLVDKYVQRAENAGKADLGFTDESRYRPVLGSASGGVQLYEVMR